MEAIRSLSAGVRRVTTRMLQGGQPLREGATTLGKRSQDPHTSERFPARKNRWISAGRGYIAAIAGVTIITLFIALVLAWVRISNISLLYLLPVLWLAAVYGRGPAIFASVLSFLAYNYFFIPPFHVFIVDDPTEWLSLLALLLTSLVLGQLTVAVRQRAREALESQQRTAILYNLAQLIVTTTEQDRLYTALAERVVEVFASQGVRACSLILRDEPMRPQTRAVAPADSVYTSTLRLEQRENASSAVWALEHGAIVGGSPVGGVSPRDALVFYVPLTSGRRVVGVLGVAGTEEMRSLIARAAKFQPPGLPSAHGSGHEQQMTLFAGFCDQIALALDRSALQQQAIHAEALRESDQLKDVLLGSVTHDLRTPLASIKAAISSLRQPDMTWSETERREFLASIDASADRLNRLVGNLLDLSRLEAGAAPPEKDWYLIGEIVATVLDRLELSGQTAEHRIVVEMPEDMPLVPMDYGQIEQVLTNLVENAVKYSPAGSEIRIAARVVQLVAPPSSRGSQPAVATAAAPATTALEVRVSDQGIGIPPGELEAIFDKFYRVQHVELPWATTRPPLGTGLGLAICDAIVRAHGGRIWAESTAGQGATFVFTLPIPQERPQGGLPALEGGRAAEISEEIERTGKADAKHPVAASHEVYE